MYDTIQAHSIDLAKPNLFGQYPIDLLIKHQQKKMVWNYSIKIKEEISE